MTENAPSKTNVVGYYNGGRFPIQLVISKLNVNLPLQVGEYILDRNGKKVNDPYFETFANNKQLSRELSDSPVAINYIPQLTTASPRPSNPVQGTANFKLNKEGIKKPLMAQPSTQQPPAADRNPVVPMSIEDARRLGLVKRVREVPEDYGDTDTTGNPSRTPPPIKYAIDPDVMRPAPPLPKELLGGATDPQRTAIISQLSKSSSAPATPESAAVFLNETANVPANVPLRAGVPQHSVRSHVKGQVGALPIVGGTPKTAVRTVTEDTGPDQDIQDHGEPEVTLSAGDLPEPDVDDLDESVDEDGSTALQPVTPNDKYVCPSCAAPFKFRSQLAKHARNKHSGEYEKIMSAYPA